VGHVDVEDRYQSNDQPTAGEGCFPDRIVHV
jgi:hypothetical protein